MDSPQRLTMLGTIVLLCVAPAAAPADDPPRAVDQRLRIELFAEHPQIRTPAGLDVDYRGRVWAIESNTHFRPEGYDGHPTDRVLVMTDTDRDGRADRIVTFADGLTHTMSVAVRPVWLDPPSFPGSAWERLPEAPPREPASDQPAPETTDHGQRTSPQSAIPNPQSASPTQVFLATRAALYLYEDTDGDLKADRRTRLVHLETRGDYPHNGLAGFAFDAMGWMYFGFGENLGESYKIIGSGGTTLSGGGEGGNVYRCRPDGTWLTLWATGFWNPHASCVDAFGRLFTVDNDPDSRPPCRLLHVIEGGDYGYRFRNGRKGTHPFTSWNGEIPGTLPMVAGTGEAPSGIVAYESDGLPDDYLGNLIVTSWGDHRIDRFRLKPKGASFESLAEPIIQGGENFRPVGLALAPDGSLYCTDWVLRDYKLHGKGRVWRIAPRDTARPAAVATAAISKESDSGRLRTFLSSTRMDVRRIAAGRLSETEQGRRLLRALLRDARVPERERVEILWAIASTPTRVHDFRLRPRPREHAPVASAYDEVAAALAPLIGSPQFPLDEGLWENVSTPTTWFTAPQRDTTWSDYSRFLAALYRLPHTTFRDMRLDIDRHSDLPLFDTERETTDDPFMYGAYITAATRWTGGIDEGLLEGLEKQRFQCFGWHERAPILRTCHLLAARRLNRTDAALRLGLTDPSPMVLRAAVQWAAEERRVEHRWLMEAALRRQPMTPDLLLATLAALDMLDGNDPKEFEKTPASKYVLPIVQDEQRPAALRAAALRLLPPNMKELSVDVLGRMLDSDDADLRLEAVRTLQTDASEPAQELLRRVAADETRDRNLRAEAVLGLAAPRDDLSQKTTDVLARLFQGTDPVLQVEAMRSLRAETANGGEGLAAILYKKITAENAPERYRREEVRRQLDVILEQPLRHELDPERPDERYLGGDPAAGRRVFFHPMSAGCSKCHTVHGRGGNVGPDLSTAGRLGRRKLIESILEPGKEVAPQFTTWALVTRDGRTHAGLIVHENEGQTTIGDPDGRTVTIATIDILERVPHRISIMPDKLAERLTVNEFRDLLSYLESLGTAAPGQPD